MIAIILIIKKVHPAYSLILGALIGGFIGGGGLTLLIRCCTSMSCLHFIVVDDSSGNTMGFRSSPRQAIKDAKIAEIPKAAEAYAPAAFIYTELFILSILLRQIIY
ncbi:MAG: hypothetical protein V8S35_06910 [Lachnospira sp.]